MDNLGSSPAGHRSTTQQDHRFYVYTDSSVDSKENINLYKTIDKKAC